MRVVGGPDLFFNEVRGNRIGTEITGAAGIPNGLDGVRLSSFFTPVDRNRIAFNGGRGVFVMAGRGNPIRKNSIDANGALGIDLLGGDEDPFGVTANDPGDVDTGANDLLNFPLFDGAVVTPSINGLLVTVRGSIDTPGIRSIELFSSDSCDPSGHGEGATLIGRWAVPFSPFSVTFGALGLGAVTATTTEENAQLIFDINTSEFSACLELPPPPPPASYLAINEIDAGVPPGQQFIELSSGGTGGVSLAGKVVVLYDGATDASYAAFDLDGQFTDPQGYFVLGNAAVPGVGLVFPDGLLQGGPEAAALYFGDATDFPAGTAVTTAGLIDAAVYGPAAAPDAGLLVLLQPDQPQVDEAAAGQPLAHSVQRCPDSSGGLRFTDTYRAAPPTPAEPNACVVCFLEPPEAVRPPGTDHTLTATVLVDAMTPTAGIVVDVEVVAGPNAGASGSVTTGADGEAAFVYPGLGGDGVDQVTASGTFGAVPFSCAATVVWFDASLIFADGFESGNTSAWSTTVP